MGSEIDQQGQLVLQPLLTYFLLNALGGYKDPLGRDFTKTEFFSDLRFSDNVEFDSSLKDRVVEVGVGNRGTVLMCLYGLLVIPFEKLKKSNKKLFKEVAAALIDDGILVYCDKAAKLGPEKNCLQDLRNAVAHAHVEFEGPSDNTTVKFLFSRGQETGFYAIKYVDLGILFSRILKIHEAYIADNQKRAAGSGA